ncbi:MAG: sensor histidine kinase [Candidatus Nanopelagicales bacterium]
MTSVAYGRNTAVPRVLPEVGNAYAAGEFAEIICDGTGTVQSITVRVVELLDRAADEVLGAQVTDLIPCLGAFRDPDGHIQRGICVQAPMNGTDGQPTECEVRTLDLRTQQANLLAVLINDVLPPGSGADDVLIIDPDDSTDDVSRANNLQLSRNLVRSVEAELARASCEIHDGVAQAMSNAVQMLQALEASADLSPEHRSHLARVRVLLRHGIADARMISRELLPASLARVGLAKTLKFELENLAMVGVSSAFVFRAPDDLDKDVETALYRITSEALLNVKKHAQAQTVSLEVDAADGWVRMSLYDDGVGFHGADVADNSQTGIGLVSMRARATLLGGSFRLMSAPRRGTLIEVKLPLAG